MCARAAWHESSSGRKYCTPVLIKSMHNPPPGQSIAGRACMGSREQVRQLQLPHANHGAAVRVCARGRVRASLVLRVALLLQKKARATARGGACDMRCTAVYKCINAHVHPCFVRENTKQTRPDALFACRQNVQVMHARTGAKAAGELLVGNACVK